MLPVPEGAKRLRKKVMAPEEDAFILRTWAWCG